MLEEGLPGIRVAVTDAVRPVEVRKQSWRSEGGSWMGLDGQVRVRSCDKRTTGYVILMEERRIR